MEAKELIRHNADGTWAFNPDYPYVEISFKAGQQEERDSWLLKTDPEKARDAFTKDVILRAYAQGKQEGFEIGLEQGKATGRREVVEWMGKQSSLRGRISDYARDSLKKGIIPN